MSSKSKVYFFFDNVRFTLKKRLGIKRSIEAIFKTEKRKLSLVNYVFCTDNALLAINRLYLKHDYYTDIITFDLSEDKDEIIGEIYISIDRVRENAISQKTSFKIELSRVIIHGSLHLCGYKDKTSLEKKEIKKKENTYLLKFK